MDNSNDYIFDPTYGYTLTELLKVRGPKEPKYFDEFWQHRYQSALTVNPAPEINVIHEDKFGWRVFSIRYINRPINIRTHPSE
jgi:cephalosporin-C deacetylase